MRPDDTGVSVRAAAIGVLVSCCALAAGLSRGENPPVAGGIPASSGGAERVEGAALEGPEPRRPSSAGRVVRSFSFDDRLPTPLPIEDWYRGQSSVERERPGFPVWNAGELDHETFGEGSGSLRLPVRGGSASVLLRDGVLPVFASADYLVTSLVRTEGLEHAGAMLEAWLTDESGNEIAGSRTRSRPVRTDSAWEALGVEVLGEDERAAFLRVELLVLQARELGGEGVGADPFRVWKEDYEGAAWFDRVEVRQLPRVEIRALDGRSERSILTRSASPPALDVLVRDLAGESLVVEVSVTDAWGRLVDSVSAPMRSGRFERRWTPRLGSHGWYRASVRVRGGQGVVVGGGRTDFVWLSPAAGVERRVADASGVWGVWSGGRIGLDFVDLNAPTLGAMEQVTAGSGVGWIGVPVWGGAGSEAASLFASGVAGDVVERLLNRGVGVCLRFDDAPAALARSLTGSGEIEALGVFGEPEALWLGWTDPALDRFGQRVRHWGVGTAERAALGRPGLPELERFRGAVGRLVPGPVVTLPWRGDLALPERLAELGARVRVHLDGTRDARGVRELASRWEGLVRDWAGRHPEADRTRGWRGPELELVLRPLSEDVYGPGASGADVVKRAVETLSAFSGSGVVAASDAGRVGRPVTVSLSDPVRESGGRRPRALATAALGAWGAMVDRLRHRRVGEELALAAGVRCFVLDDLGPEGDGAIVLWREDASSESVELSLQLGEGEVRVVDLFGNVSPVGMSSPGARQRPEHRVRVTADPVFVEGVDTDLVRLLASVRLEPGLVRATPHVHRHELVIDNPMDRAIRGRAYILEPGGFSDGTRDPDRGWSISPRVCEISLSPFGSARVGLDIEFSPATPAGEVPLVVDLELERLGGGGLIRVRRTLEVGVEELGLTVYPRYGSVESAGDAFVVAEVTSRADRAMDLELVCVVPGHPRAKATINGLQPGETVVRTFALPGAGAGLVGVEGAVSVTESGGSGGFRLIRSVRFE